MSRDLSPPASVRPTYVRYGVLAFACTLSMITYLDRASISNAVPDILAVYGFKAVSDLTWAFFVFSLSYALFEVPTGWLGDVFGPRRTLIRIVLWWSVFTALTGLAGITLGKAVLVPFLALVAIRFLFGIGEAGAYPNITRALHNWFPPQERGMTQGAVWTSGRLIGGLTPLIWTILVVNGLISWRAAFWLFGGLGVVWCLLFTIWFRNRPEEKPSVNEAERQLIRAGIGHEADKAAAAVPWGRLFRSRTLWALCLMYFCMSYGWYFNLSYLPDYLEQQHGVARADWVGSLYKGGPLIFGAVGCLLGGYLTDFYIRRTGNRRWGRRIFGIFGHIVCVPLYLYCLIAPSAWTFALALALTGFFNDLAMGSCWAACQDVGRKHAAIVAGCMNTIGNLGGAAATWLTGTILGLSLNTYAQAHGLNLDALKADPSQKGVLDEALRNGLLPGYQINFIIFAAVYIVAVFLWFGIDATKPVLPEDADTGVRPG